MSNAMSAASSEEAAIKRLSPTLFIALGGSGKEILLRLRRRLLQSEWNGERINRLSDFPLASFLYFDLDQATAVETGRSLDNDPLAGAIAFDQAETMQEKFDSQGIVNNIKRHPEIREWWPEADIKSIDVTKGAGQVRPLSRMAFFLQSQDFRTRVRRKSTDLLNSLSHQDKLRRLGLEASNKLNIIVVGSAAGGTGSGSFIDVGLMLRSDRDPAPAAVELYLLLPGGFTGANAERVQANSYAALMELELTMRPNSQPRYAERWNTRDIAGTGMPYDDIYLLDTKNLVGQGTGNVTDLYNMIADILFEDFSAAELADRKQSIAVNQRGWKTQLYYPALPDEAGGSILGYSRGFSAIGQATLDSFGLVNMSIDERRCMLGMIDAYFSIGIAAGAVNAPTTDQRDRFLRDQLDLGPDTFNRFPPDLDEDVPTITEFDIVNRLLVRGDNSAIDGALEARVDAEVNALLDSLPKPQDWAGRLHEYREKLRGDVETTPTQTGGPPVNREITDARRRIVESWRSGKGLRNDLYTMLDNKEGGGLDYTIGLIEMVREAINNGSNSIIETLKQAQDAYGRLATKMLNDRFDRQLDNLRETEGLPFWKPRSALFKTYADNARNDLKLFMVYRTRARACEEARNALGDLLTYLGQRRPPTENGQESGTGLIAEFLQGRNDVRAVRASLEFEIRTLNDGAGRRDGMYMVIDRDRVRKPLEFDVGQLRSWAHQAFSVFGGSNQLFPLLRQPGGGLKLLIGLSKAARENLSPVADQVPSLITVLESMGPVERHRAFQDLLVRAMPWVTADTASMKSDFNADQYKIFVAISDQQAFRNKFGADFASCLPSPVSAQRDAINYVEAPVAGRMVVLCVLTGIPLDVIPALKNIWRVSYNQVNKPGQALPLHNHKDAARFPHPVVPDDAELHEMRERMALLLRAILFGITTRMSDLASVRDAASLDQYVAEMQPGFRTNIGSERVLRSGVFLPAHKQFIQSELLKFEGTLRPVQLLAAAALCRYTALRAYAKKPMRTSGGQDDHKAGLMHVVALQLEKKYTMLFSQRKNIVDLPPAATLLNRLFDNIALWTDEIEGSIDDADPVEVNVDPSDALNGAQPKRKINKVAFDEEQLRRNFVDMIATTIVAPASPPSVEVPAEPSYHVAINGADTGRQSFADLRRLALEGKLTGDTKVWNEDLAGWTRVSEVPVLARLLGRRFPPPLSMSPPPL